MHHQAAVAFKEHHVAGLDGTGRAADFKDVTGLHAGEHAGAGDRKANCAERSQDFGGQIEFEGFYQLVFITRL